MVDLGVIASSLSRVGDVFLDVHFNIGIDIAQFATTTTSRYSYLVCKAIKPCTSHLLLNCASRFLSSAEQRHIPIQGEVLTVAWLIELSRYFKQDYICSD